MVRKIIRFPNPSLKSECAWIRDEKEIVEHIQDLKDTLAATSNGIALASNQILEKGFRVFVVKPGTKLPEVCINPRWSLAHGSQLWRPEEGCLSIPELRTRSSRQSRITFSCDLKNHMTLEGIESQIVQHECEHLDGKSLADHLSQRELTKLRMEVIRNRKAGR